MSRIYVASSWSNPHQPMLVEELRQRGHKVYDFRHPSGRDDRDVWEETGISGTFFHDALTGETGLSGSQLSEALLNEQARARFREHSAAMQDADTCVLFLPCGRSSHIEAGYMKGLGKRVYVFGSQFDIHKPELMYLTLDGFFYLYDDLFAALDAPLPGSCNTLARFWRSVADFLHIGGRELPSTKDDPLTHHCDDDE